MAHFVSNAIVWDGRPSNDRLDPKPVADGMPQRSSKTWKKKFKSPKERREYMREAKRLSRERLRSADPSYGRSKDRSNPRSFLYKMKKKA